MCHIVFFFLQFYGYLRDILLILRRQLQMFIRDMPKAIVQSGRHRVYLTCASGQADHPAGGEKSQPNIKIHRHLSLQGASRSTGSRSGNSRMAMLLRSLRVEQDDCGLSHKLGGVRRRRPRREAEKRGPDSRSGPWHSTPHGRLESGGRADEGIRSPLGPAWHRPP